MEGQRDGSHADLGRRRCRRLSEPGEVLRRLHLQAGPGVFLMGVLGLGPRRHAGITGRDRHATTGLRVLTSVCVSPFDRYLVV